MPRGLRFSKDCSVGSKGSTWAITVSTWDFIVSMDAIAATVWLLLLQYLCWMFHPLSWLLFRGIETVKA